MGRRSSRPRIQNNKLVKTNNVFEISKRNVEKHKTRIGKNNIGRHEGSLAVNGREPDEFPWLALMRGFAT